MFCRSESGRLPFAFLGLPHLLTNELRAQEIDDRELYTPILNW